MSSLLPLKQLLRVYTTQPVLSLTIETRVLVVTRDVFHQQCFIWRRKKTQN